MTVRGFLVVVAIVILVSLWSLWSTGCDDAAPAPPDAASCSSLGCEDVALCTRDGVCFCDGARCEQ